MEPNRTTALFTAGVAPRRGAPAWVVVAGLALFASVAVQVHVASVRSDAAAAAADRPAVAPPSPAAPSATPSRRADDAAWRTAAAREMLAEQQARSEQARARPTPATPTTAPTVACHTQQWACDLVDTAVDTLDYPWRDLGWSVTVEEEQPWLAGYASWSSRTVTLYPREHWTVDTAAYVFAHEVGHAVYVTHMTPERKSAYRYARGIASDVPEHVKPPHEFDSVAEDFAEMFAWWHTRVAFRSSLAPLPARPQDYVWYFYPDR